MVVELISQLTLNPNNSWGFSNEQMLIIAGISTEIAFPYMFYYLKVAIDKLGFFFWVVDLPHHFPQSFINDIIHLQLFNHFLYLGIATDSDFFFGCAKVDTVPLCRVSYPLADRNVWWMTFGNQFKLRLCYCPIATTLCIKHLLPNDKLKQKKPR